ncbi:DUF223 domain-containing protein [Caenorhabditis elegans]|uniref:DUF223 domain-containing protein n=1 Tax=Caenorhabditis elegans TaxID=6239 RepID=Q17791_CAEEL|nr:DUF223 domain-containing protein [Caenorhabditis elegans]CAA90099.2 DUF223 domain-containing protein [Caenorhabditis elegans]|eukprot:NP_496229.2 Uncharacterized protein CELE_C07E3.8 [Caenorhabditis elegans]
MIFHDVVESDLHDWECDDDYVCKFCTVRVNNWKIEIYQLWHYFFFLKDVVGVIVRKLNIAIDRDYTCEGLHVAGLIGYDYDKVEEYTGMCTICKLGDCGGMCRRVVEHCKKCGPIQEGVFETPFEKPHHFESLEITSFTIDCLLYGNRFRPTLVNFKNAPITVDSLSINAPSSGIPKVFLSAMMISKWKVKTLHLVVVGKNILNEVTVIDSKNLRGFPVCNGGASVKFDWKNA